MTATTATIPVSINAEDYAFPEAEYAEVQRTIRADAIRSGMRLDGRSVERVRFGTKWITPFDSDGKEIGKFNPESTVEVVERVQTPESVRVGRRVAGNRALAAEIKRNRARADEAMEKFTASTAEYGRADEWEYAALMSAQTARWIWENLVTLAETNSDPAADLVSLHATMAEDFQREVNRKSSRALNRSSSILSNLMGDVEVAEMIRFIEMAPRNV